MTLRSQLQKITFGEETIPQHPGQIDALQREYPHTIKVLDGAEHGLPAIDAYTCFMHALEIAESNTYVALYEAVYGLFWADSRFVRFLVESGQLRHKEANEAQSGDLVIYFVGDEPKHAGRLVGARVISKWGIGHLYEHGLLEVPLQYGLPRFFHPLSEGQTCAAFRAYLHSKGMRVEIDDTG